MCFVNSVTLEGTISDHLDIRYFDYEHLRVKLQLYTIEKGLKADGSDWEQWHNIEFSNLLAKQAEELLKKGDKIRVEGRISYHKELDREGRKRYVTIIHGRSFTLLDKTKVEDLEEVVEDFVDDRKELEWDKFSVNLDEDPMA